jgi:hypothetical protein
MANNNQQGQFNRKTGYDSDSSFNSLAKPLWNRVMQNYYMSFDNIQQDDLRGENSIFMFSTFANHLAASPPISPRTRKVYGSDSLRNAVGFFVDRLNHKFQHITNETLFPDAEVARWEKTVVVGRNHTMMEGEKENDLFKKTFPLP